MMEGWMMIYNACRPLPAVLLTGFGVVIAATTLLAQESSKQADPAKEAKPVIVVPNGLAKLEYPDGTPPTAQMIALGKQLFFDPRLSSDGTVSCASCHDPQQGWTTHTPVATGVGGQQGTRNAPTLVNTAYNIFHFWDGRAASLEEQALGPIANPVEMNMPIPKAVETINRIDGYREQFNAIFGSDVTKETLCQAISAFERTILSGNAPYDRFKAGDKSALSESARRGMELFFGKANCSACHSGSNFTDNAFHNVGVGMNEPSPDLGRYTVSGLGGDKGAFKTPTLRDVARTAPYMHDGSMETLQEVMEHYNKGGTPNPYQDEEIFPLELTEQEINDLITFMKEGLASKNYPTAKAPELPGIKAGDSSVADQTATSVE